MSRSTRPHTRTSPARRSRGLAARAAMVVLGGAVVLATAATPIALAADGGGDGRSESRSWDSYFDDLRPVAIVDARQVVVLFDDPSLGEWEAAGERPLTPAMRRAWVGRAIERQQARLDALTAAGVQFDVEHRYVRVVNGASLVVHGDGAQLLRGVKGVRSVSQVRSVWPAAQVSKPTKPTKPAKPATPAKASRAGTARAAELRAAGAAGAAQLAAQMGVATEGDGAVRVAVLDTGVDAGHPAVRGHVVAGFDAMRATEGVAPGEFDDHGTGVAGAVLDSAGDRADVDIVPVRIFDARPVLGGLEAVVGSSDDLLAGLEWAVDPDADGDVADGVDVAVIAATTPYASFTGSPEDRAVAGATALGTVVVAAAGNDGAGGDTVGTVGSIAASSSALAVGATDLRGSAPVVDVRARGGALDVVVGDAPLLVANATVPGGELPLVEVKAGGTDVVDYLDDDLRSRVTGAAVLVARREGSTIADQVRAANDAGAAAVLVSGAGSAASAGTIDVQGVDIPAIGLGAGAASNLREALGRGIAVRIELDDDPAARNAAFGMVAGFSSQGPRLDGVARPDVLAPGVGMVVAGAGVAEDGAPEWRVVTGTSVAAAWAAGEVVALRAAHPDWSADTVRAALLATAIPLGENGSRPPVEAQGAGVLDADAAAKATAIVPGGRLDFGRVAPGDTGRVRLAFTTLDGGMRPGLPPALQLDTGGRDGGPVPTIDGGYLVVAPAAGTRAGIYGGWIVVKELGIRIPWSVTVDDAATRRVPIVAKLDEATLRPSTNPGAFGSRLQLSIGGVAGGSGLGLDAVQQLEVRLVDAKGRDRGAVGGLDLALPGVYTFGVTGIAPNGKPLGAGEFDLRVRYVSAAAPEGTWTSGPSVHFTIGDAPAAPQAARP